MDEQTLTSALAALTDHAIESESGTRTVLHPGRILQARGIADDALHALAFRGAIVRQGNAGWRLTTTELPPITATDDGDDAAQQGDAGSTPEPTGGTRPMYVLVMDTENVLRTHEEFGIKFDPIEIRRRAREQGDIIFAFALGNFEALSSSVRQTLRLADFPILHCEDFHVRDERKDTVDQKVVATLYRILRLRDVAGVIVASDDRDFVDAFALVQDFGKIVVAMTLRENGALATVASRVIPMYEERFIWRPDQVIDWLKLLPVLPPEARGGILRTMEERSPFVCRILAKIIQLRCWGEDQSVWTEFRDVEEELWESLYPKERQHVARNELRRFLNILRSIGVARSEKLPTTHGARIRWSLQWQHPFCAHVLRAARQTATVAEQQPTLRVLEGGGSTACPAAPDITPTSAPADGDDADAPETIVAAQGA